MAGKKMEGSVALESPHEELDFVSEPVDGSFDIVEYTCSCPRCGAPLSRFRTKDLCNQMDTVDYRIAYHFYAECECGAWIDFIRKAARGIDDFDMYVE